MVKMAILFKKPADETAFEEHYPAHLLILEAMPGLVRRQAGMIFGSPAGPSPYYRLVELYFNDYAALDAALTSVEGRAAGQEIMAFAGRNAEIFFAEVFEE